MVRLSLSRRPWLFADEEPTIALFTLIQQPDRTRIRSRALRLYSHHRYADAANRYPHHKYISATDTLMMAKITREKHQSFLFNLDKVTLLGKN
jgi:hypothetical protein